MGSPSRRCGPPRTSGTRRRSSPGRSCRRRPRSGSTGSSRSAQFWADPTGLTFPIVNEELFWGDAGIGMAIFGTTLAVAGIFGSGTPEQLGRVGAAVLRDRGRRQGRRRSARPSRTPARTSRGYRTTAKYDEAKDEWVLNGQKAWATNGGIANVHVVIATRRSRAGLARPRRLRHPPGHQGAASRAPRSKKHGIRASHTADVHLDDVPGAGQLPAGRQGEAGREARQGPRGQELQGPGRDADLRALAARRSPRRRSASPARPTSTRSTTPRSARPGAARSSRTRRSPSRWPT